MLYRQVKTDMTKIVVIMEFLWAGGITCIKLSILLFYAKIFAVRKFKIAAKAAACLVVAWCISKSLRDTVVRPLIHRLQLFAWLTFSYVDLLLSTGILLSLGASVEIQFLGFNYWAR